MLRSYGISIVGQYHLAAGSDVCQDAHAVRHIGDGAAVAVVADGVGSESHSEIGSRAAADACAEFCVSNYGSYDDRKSLLNDAFRKALYSVREASETKGIPMNQMDCTLCAVLVTPEGVYCGNVGDSGALGLASTGEYKLLTEQQNDDSGAVFPLVSEPHWEFSYAGDGFCSILVATDGFYNRLFPAYLEGKTHNGLDYELVAEYADPSVIPGDADLEPYINSRLDLIPRDGGWDGINDDITVVGLISDKGHGTFAPYGAPIDRRALKSEYNAKVKEALYGKNAHYSADMSDEEDAPAHNHAEYSLDEVCAKLGFLSWKGEPAPEGTPMSALLEDTSKVSVPRRTKIAYNLSSVMELCHRMKLVPGIVSLDNISVDSKGKVTLCGLDRDRVRLNDSPAPVRASEVDIDRNVSADGWVPEEFDLDSRLEDLILAVVVYRLLFNGHSPYVRTEDGRCVYRVGSGAEDPSVPDMSQFPPYLRSVFGKAFGPGDDVPSAADIKSALDHYSVDIDQCERKHIRFNGAEFCPYCRAEDGRKGTE